MKLTHAVALALFMSSISLSDEPVNDLFVNRILLTGAKVTSSGSNLLAGRELGEPAHNEGDRGNSVWWSWTAPSAGWVSITTAGSDFDTVLAVYSGNDLSSLALQGWNDDWITSSDDLTSRVQFLAEAGVTYSIAVEGYYDEDDDQVELDEGAIRLHIAPGSADLGPSWNLPDLNGRFVASTSLAGRVSLVVFWNTSEARTIAQVPALLNLYTKYQELGLEVVGMFREDDVLAKSVVDQYSITFKTLRVSARVEEEFNSIGIQYRNLPTTFIIDRSGVIVARQFGVGTEAALEQSILPLISAVANPPALGVIQRDGNIVLSWKQAETAPVLEHSDGIAGPWKEISPPRHTQDEITEVTLSASEAAGFFRLHQ